MSNLKGSDFSKNIKNSMIRLNKLGSSKRGCERENQTHSLKTQQVRQSLLNDFKTYLENNNLTDKKLNEYMDNKTTTTFLKERTQHLSVKSAETFIRGFGSLLNGLRETGVSISLEKEIINSMVKELKEDYKPTPTSEISKSFNDVENVVNKLYEKSFEYGVLGQLLKESGLRHNEGVELLKNPQKYITDNSIHSLSGKGGFTYQEKFISSDLISKIINIENIPNHKSFYNSINQIEPGKSSHPFRYSYVLSQMEIKQHNQGLSYKQALKEVSKEINHRREEITKYYLNRC